ncbi:MAG: hypothetical protein JRJ29_00275 [Deltaproteobacteria bacterium]|nr:hypothetical protein [Deltaproteobacteria bacterium]MBW2081599.1 hypothetical protein [Deltaproteobacteria bacterium]
MERAEIGKRELDTLFLMASRWADSYRKLRKDLTDHTCFAEDLKYEIQTMMMPYVTRLHKLEYISDSQLVSFLQKIQTLLADFLEEMKEDPAVALARGLDYGK